MTGGPIAAAKARGGVARGGYVLRDIGSLRRAYRDSVDDRGLVYMRYGAPAAI